jgi:hypothetical protein
MRWEEIWDAALRIRNRFLRASVPDEIVAAVETCLSNELRDSVLAVRSSAPGEDSESASFAGLHESVVGVSGVDPTVEATRQVWASLWSARSAIPTLSSSRHLHNGRRRWSRVFALGLASWSASLPIGRKQGDTVRWLN